MARILLPSRPWTAQPPLGVGLNESSPLLRRLLWGFNYAGQHIGGLHRPQVTYRAGYALRDGSQGRGIQPNVANAGFTFVVPSTTLDEYTLVVVADLPSRASPVGGDAVLVGNASGIGVYEYNAGADLKSFAYYAPDYTGTATAHMIGISVVPASGRLVVVQTYRRGAHLRNYVNGAFINQATPLDYPARWGGGAYGSEISVGSHRAQTIGVQATWLQAASLDDEEARRVSGDPWQAFEERRRVLVPTAGASGAIAGTATCTFGAGSSTVSGAGALAGVSAATFGAGSSTLRGDGALAGTAAGTFGAGASALTGSGSLAGAGALTFAGSLTVSGDVSGTADVQFGAGASTLSGAGVLAGAAEMAFSATGAAAGAGALSGAAAGVFSASGAVLGSGSLAGTAPLTFGAGSSVLIGAGSLAGTSALTFAASLQSQGGIAGAVAVAFTAAGAAAGAGALVGASASAFSASAALAGAAAVAGAATVQFTPAASASGAGTLAASVAIVFSPTGTLVNATSGAITGAAAMVLSPAAALLGAGALTAATQIIVGSTATLTDAVPGVFTSNSRQRIGASKAAAASQRIGPEAGGVSKQRIGDTTL